MMCTGCQTPILTTANYNQDCGRSLELANCYLNHQTSSAYSARREDTVHATTPLRLRTGCLTHPGRMASLNQDSLSVMHWETYADRQDNPGLSLLTVADGMGGHQLGELASKIAVRCLAETLLNQLFLPLAGGEFLLPENLEIHLAGAVRAANEAILRVGIERGVDLGTTLTTALVYGSQVAIASAGDSRAYLLRDRQLQQVTRDHSLVADLVKEQAISQQEARYHPRRHVIYRSLGDIPALEVDTFFIILQAGDRLVLCSDGLWGMVPDQQLFVVATESDDPQSACDKLVEIANQAGGEDNISVIIAEAQPLVTEA